MDSLHKSPTAKPPTSPKRETKYFSDNSFRANTTTHINDDRHLCDTREMINKKAKKKTLNDNFLAQTYSQVC